MPTPYDSPLTNEAMNTILASNAVLAGDPTLLAQVEQLLEPLGSSSVVFGEFKDGALTSPTGQPIQALAITSSSDTQTPIVLDASVAWFANNANNIKYYSFGGPVNPLTGKQTPVQMTYAIGDPVILSGGGDDIYRLGSSSANITLLGGGGNDQITTGAGADSVSGDSGNDIIAGGNGNDTLNGGDGNDTIAGDAGDDILQGGTGIDVMRGGLGNDIYYVDNTRDSVIEGRSQGVDKVISSITYTLRADVEDLELSGTNNINGTGNSLANLMIGNTGNNVLNSGSGNDTLNGGIGADSLTGGSGNDRFVYSSVSESATGGIDRITDFVRSTDLIDLTGMGFTWIGTDNFTAANQLRYSTSRGITTIEGNTTGTSGAEFILQLSGTLNLTANDFLGVTVGTTPINGDDRNNKLQGTSNADIINGFGGNDQLLGLAGNDALNGGSGNDSLAGGVGSDSLTGGSGDDRFIFSAGDSSSVSLDQILDFSVASRTERIDLSAIDANVLTRGNGSFSWIGTQSITAAGQLNALQQGSNTIIQGNTDSNVSTFEFVLVLVGVNAVDLTSSEFIL